MGLKLSPNVMGIPKRFEHCSFDTFKVNKQNESIFNICKNWEGKDSITLTGNPGTGKTHLAISMLRIFPMQPVNGREKEHNQYKVEQLLKEDIAEEEKIKLQKYLDEKLYNFRKARCLFVPFVELFIQINTAAMEDGGKLAILEEYSNGKEYDCICFDDLGAEKLTEAKRENLYYIIDSRYREMLPTIVTSNFTIQEISETEPRIASRFAEMGNILQFTGTDYRKLNEHK